MILASPPRPPVDPDDANTLWLDKYSTYLFQIVYEGRYPPEVLCYWNLIPSDGGGLRWLEQLSEFIYIYFLFFRHQGFRMIIFDRQAGPFQNFNRSQVMVIGRSVSFSDPAPPPGGGVGRPKHPKIPPPQIKFVCVFCCVLTGASPPRRSRVF